MHAPYIARGLQAWLWGLHTWLWRLHRLHAWLRCMHGYGGCIHSHLMCKGELHWGQMGDCELQAHPRHTAVLFMHARSPFNLAHAPLLGLPTTAHPVPILNRSCMQHSFIFANILLRSRRLARLPSRLRSQRRLLWPCLHQSLCPFPPSPSAARSGPPSLRHPHWAVQHPLSSLRCSSSR